MHVRKCADIENHQQRLQRHSPRFTGLATTCAERACYKNQEIKQPTLQLWVERDKSTSIWWLPFTDFHILVLQIKGGQFGEKTAILNTWKYSKNWLKKQQKKNNWNYNKTDNHRGGKETRERLKPRQIKYHTFQDSYPLFAAETV